jgi:hypothetical protein
MGRPADAEGWNVNHKEDPAALVFWSLVQARVVISDWKADYNHRRRHSALGYRSRPVAWCRTRSDGIAAGPDRSKAL